MSQATPAPPAIHRSVEEWLFGCVSFLSAFLLFWIQPLAGKTLLPILGGGASVWNTCILFFQILVLAGYAYTHWLPRHLGPYRHAALHLLLLGAGMLWLPMSLPDQLSGWAWIQSHPVLWTLAYLTASIGLPFFVLSTTAPLMQMWLNLSGGNNPYRLYAASNSGSLLALVLFPALLEPRIGLHNQGLLWTWIYLGNYLLIIGSALALNRTRQDRTAQTPYQAQATTSPSHSRIPNRRRLYWVAMSFLPSSLMLGVTQYFSTEIASLPLFWVVPLGLYLFSFIWVFSSHRDLSHASMVKALPYTALSLVFLLVAHATGPVWLLMVVHLGFFTVVCMLCHGRMAMTKPDAEHLTEFYVWMALGGMAGGLFNAILAPLIFTHIIEYPLIITLACLLQGTKSSEPKPRFHRRLNLLLPALLILAMALLTLLAAKMHLAGGILRTVLIVGLPLVFCFTFHQNYIRFGLGLGVLLFSSDLFLQNYGKAIYAKRNFYGLSRVVDSPTRDARLYYHGNTLHGSQMLAPDIHFLPTSYYHPKGPVGDVMELMHQQQSSNRVAIIGLGIGSIAAYARETDSYTFFEIDPVVIQVALNTNYFTFLENCRAGRLNIVEGDARLRIAKVPPQSYDLIILDAFSSDAIPPHLLNREALRLYREKLVPGGWLMMHLSNRYLDLPPLIATLAADAGLHLYARQSMALSSDSPPGMADSYWAVFGETPESLETLARRKSWGQVLSYRQVPVWTDDYSNLTPLIRWD